MCVSKILRPSLCQFFSQFLTVFCYLCLPGNAGILCRGKSWNWEKNKWNSIVAKATLLVENFSSVTLQLYEIVLSNLLLGRFYSKEFCYCHFFHYKAKAASISNTSFKSYQTKNRCGICHESHDPGSCKILNGQNFTKNIRKIKKKTVNLARVKKLTKSTSDY